MMSLRFWSGSGDLCFVRCLNRMRFDSENYVILLMMYENWISVVMNLMSWLSLYWIKIKWNWLDYVFYYVRYIMLLNNYV